METEEEKSGALKRPRDPLSDSDDGNQPASEAGDGQKRRRLEASGRENRSPKPSSGRLLELEVKPDTPIVPSVRTRVEQLSQRSDGVAPPAPGAPRCASDPSGGDGRGFREQLLGEREFNQRLERFRVPAFPGSSASSPSPSRAAGRSDLVAGIQQRLTETRTTPSSKQASRLRQEREQELSQLHFQPISENAWLKRSASFLLQEGGGAQRNDGSFTEASAAAETSDPELSSSSFIHHMFQEVLEYAQEVQEEEQQQEEEEKEEEEQQQEEEEESKALPAGPETKSEEELLTFPPSGILSPLGKSIEAAVTPLRLAGAQEASGPPPPPLSAEQKEESAPLYSVDAYRTQRQKKPRALQSAAAGAHRPDNQPRAHVDSKERIAVLNEEAAKLQTVINQTLQALSCCTDEDHGRGSLEEAEAERLLLLSSEKRSALLSEVSRLREERSSPSSPTPPASPSRQACRGTVSIAHIRLPLKLEFLCSSQGRAARPSHYFFVLIRYGPCNVVATPLATAADVQNGDTISFPTSVTLTDIRSSFEIDVEVYSLSNASGSSSMERPATAKSRVTPRKLLSSITRSSNMLTSVAPPPGARRCSSFSLVGSQRLSLASLGRTKFPLDKMKLEGKIRRLLGDEFQEKVPFLSPLEGSIYLRLDSRGHSSVQHRGFLTMFQLVSGFGVWNRRYFVLEGNQLSYWNHPNDRETKEAEGSLSLSTCPPQGVQTVQRDSCARPFTFQLLSSVQPGGDAGGHDTSLKLSADTRQEKQDWMEKLSQALLDFHTWSPAPSEDLRESTL